MQNKSIKPEPEYFKCPECGHRTELEYSGAISITKCERCRLFGNRNLWDKWADSERICLEWRKAYDCLETELERTRKALELALAELQEIDGCCEDNKYADNVYVGLDGHDTRNIALDVKKTIAEITALTKGGDND